MNIKHYAQILLISGALFGIFQQANAACNVTNQPAANQLKALYGSTLGSNQATQPNIKQISGATNVRVTAIVPVANVCIPMSTMNYAPDEVNITVNSQNLILFISC